MAVRTVFPDLTPLDYWGLLLRKLPPGVLWAQQRLVTGATYVDGLPVPLTRFSRLLMGAAGELARVHNRLNDLFRESRPSTTTELLSEWEVEYGLPEFGYLPTTIADRQAALVGKFSATGGASRGYFEGLAESYGADAVVSTGPWPHWWTVSMQDDCMRACCTSSCNAALVEFTTPAGARVAHAFTAYGPASNPIFWDGAIAP